MADYIPQDVLIDILSRLPAETLVRFTSVCKSWHSLITSPKFISHHLHRNASDRLRLVRYYTREPRQEDHYSFPEILEVVALRYPTDGPETEHYSLVLDGNDSFRQVKAFNLPSNSVSYSIVGSVNGVVCLSDDREYGHSSDIFLWNPSIRKFVALPKYNFKFQSNDPFEHCLGFGFDPVANDFKVVRIVPTSFFCDGKPPLVELYTHKTGHWRCISGKALPLMITRRCPQAYVNGAANWMAFTRETPSTPFRNTILSFNMSEELFKEILVPESVTHDHENSHMKRMMILAVHKESLCLIQQCVYPSEQHCSVWVMKEYGVSTSWSKLFRIDLREDMRRPLGLRINGEVIFLTENGDLVSCDQSRHIMYLGIHGTFCARYLDWSTFYVDNHTESLVLLNKLESPQTTVFSG